MRNTTITVDTSVDVDLSDVIDMLEYSDVIDWFNDLASVEKSEFIEEFADDLSKSGVSLLDLLGDAMESSSLDEALEVIIKEYHASPYMKGLIVDRLNEAKIIQP